MHIVLLLLHLIQFYLSLCCALLFWPFAEAEAATAKSQSTLNNWKLRTLVLVGFFFIRKEDNTHATGQARPGHSLGPEPIKKERKKKGLSKFIVIGLCI